MSTTTDTASWPTEASFEPAGKALNSAYNEVERIEWNLRSILGPWLDEGKRPEESPTLDTIGALWSFLDGLRTEIAQLEQEAQRLEQHLGQIDSLRLDGHVWKAGEASS